jgi:serine protease Do
MKNWARVIRWMAAVVLGFGVWALAESSTAPSAGATTAPGAESGTAGWDAGHRVARDIYLKARGSLVVVKFTWASELASREFTAAGAVVSDDGLVMFPITIVTPIAVPNDQMKNFKVILPRDDADDLELDATLQGRDERTSLAFVKVNEKREWSPIKFVDAGMEVGQPVYSVGILPKGAGYKAWVSEAMISAKLRGPVPQMLLTGDSAGAGSVVFNRDEQAIGYVHPRDFREAMLDDPRKPEDMSSVYSAPKLFVPAGDFLETVKNPPVAGQRVKLPWLGCILNGLEKQDADYFNLQNVPAVQVGDVLKDSPAEKAGLKTLDVIVKINGKALVRGDLPAELSSIITRQVQRMNVGDEVTLSVIRHRGEEPVDVKVTLSDGPKQYAEARRFYAKDLGFVVREILFQDTYNRKMNPNTGGVVVALMRPQAAAQAASLRIDEMITQMNGKPVTDLDQFKKDYLKFRKENPTQAVVLEAIQEDGKEETINIEPPQTGAVPGESGN